MSSIPLNGPLTSTDFARIYHLFDRAVTADINDHQHGTASHEPGIADAAEIVTELYGIDALRQVLTGRSPRAGGE